LMHLQGGCCLRSSLVWVVHEKPLLQVGDPHKLGSGMHSGACTAGGLRGNLIKVLAHLARSSVVHHRSLVTKSRKEISRVLASARAWWHPVPRGENNCSPGRLLTTLIRTSNRTRLRSVGLKRFDLLDGRRSGDDMSDSNWGALTPPLLSLSVLSCE
jgi:hypothetical protein